MRRRRSRDMYGGSLDESKRVEVDPWLLSIRTRDIEEGCEIEEIE